MRSNGKSGSGKQLMTEFSCEVGRLGSIGSLGILVVSSKANVGECQSPTTAVALFQKSYSQAKVATNRSGHHR